MRIKRMETAYVAMNPHRCMACWKCLNLCPKNVIGKVGFPGHRHVIFKNADACIGCGKCLKACPHGVFFKADETDCQSNPKSSSRIERLLPLTLAASAISGIGLHLAGHGLSHETWHNWGVAHVLISLLWLLSIGFHIKRHKHWYKTIHIKRFNRRSWITLALSAVSLIIVASGILLLTSVDGPNSAIGLWHYRLGLLLLPLSVIHPIKKR